MDTTKTITHVSLCAGYGGIDLGLSRAIPNLRTIAFSEIEAFACANLVAKMEAGLLDAAPIWTNLKTFPWESFRDRVDILSGGYPCQPFSAAGKRLGTDDPRHLWPFIAAGIISMRPRVCFFENVEGHISLGLREVISELEDLGYKVAWGIFSAREVGAPHQRKRVFILAHTGDEQQFSRHVTECGGSTAWPSRPGQPQHGWEPPRVVGNTSSQRCKQDPALRSEQQASGTSEKCGAGVAEAMGNAQHDGSHQRGEESRGSILSSEQGWMQELEGGSASVGDSETGRRGEGGDETCERQGHRAARPSWSDDELSQAQSSLGGDADGSTDWLDDAELFVTSDNRTDELRLLGNGVVPATATRAFLTLMDQLLNQ